jgi:hypothetical protein
MSLSKKQLCSISFAKHLKEIDNDFFKELSLEYAEDSSASFSFDSFLSQEEEFMELWAECDHQYFYQILEQSALMCFS